MYTEQVKEEIKEIKELKAGIDRLKVEAKLYDGVEAEPILYNIEKLEDKYNQKKEIMLEKYEITKKQLDEGFKQKKAALEEDFEKQKKELEEPYNKKISKYKERIARFEEDKKVYANDNTYIESLENNIRRVEDEISNLENTEGKEIENILKEKENDINARIEDTKQKINSTMETINKDLEGIGIDVKVFKIGEIEQKEVKEEEIKEEIVKEQEIKEEKMEERTTNTKLSDTLNISIRYLAETDQYELTDEATNQIYICNRRDLAPVDKNIIAEKLNLPIQKLNSMSSDIVRILRKFDKINGTHKLRQYIKAITKTELSKKEMKEKMNSIGIQIDYDLRGLYEKDKYSPTEIQEILETANNAKKIGSGRVKKGIITTIREKLGNAINRIKNTKLLTAGRQEQDYIEQKTNAEYWKSIDKKEFKEAIKQAHKEKDLREKLDNIKDENSYIEMMNPELNAIDKMEKAAKEKLEIKSEEDELEI